MKHALLQTLPGRAIVVGLAIKLAVGLLRAVAGSLPAFVGVVDTVASVVVVAGAVYFLLRGIAVARRRLLWRIRRKLIISYIFIGFIPAILIVAFFMLGGLLLFSYFSSYLMQSRLAVLSERAASMARNTALEIQRSNGRDLATIVANRQEAAEQEFPGASIAVLATRRRCGAVTADADPPGAPVAIAGPWAHVAPPPLVPAWVDCSGFHGLLAYGPQNGTIVDTTAEDDQPITDVELVARALQFPETEQPRYAVVVDLLVNGAAKEQFRNETGVELTALRTAPGRRQLLQGRLPRQDAAPRPTTPDIFRFGSVSFLDYSDWTAGGRGGSVVATMQFSIAEIYSKISAAQGLVGDRRQSFGEGLLLFLIFIGVLFLVIAVIALIVGLALARSISGSVHALFTGTERVRQGDFTHKIDVHAEDQLGELAASFNSMTDSIEDLLRQAAEKKRLEEELRIAHEIQMSLLPQGPLHIPGMSVTALCVPAREVGGDYYDFLPIDEHRVGVLIADVSGKGTSAALYMAELKGVAMSLSRSHTSPRELLLAMNRILADHLDARSFITVSYAVIDLRKGTMTYARAGHTPLIYLPGPVAEGRKVRILAPDGLVVGLKLDDVGLFERLLEEETIPLAVGDLFLFFTDGITEAMNAEDDCFGDTRLARLIEEHAHLPSDQLRERLLREITAFVGDSPQHDDMTLILLKVEEVAAGVVAATLAAEPVGVAD